MFWELVPHTLHEIINVVGHWPNKVSITCVEGKTNESEISLNILDIGTDLGDELQGVVNINSIPLTNSTTLLIPI